VAIGQNVTDDESRAGIQRLPPLARLGEMRLQGLGQSIIPTIAGALELIMRATAGIVLVDALGFLGACLGNPMAWLGSCVPLAIAYFMTVRRLLKEVR